MQVGVSDIRLAASDPHDRSVRAPAREGHSRLGGVVGTAAAPVRARGRVAATMNNPQSSAANP